MSSVVATWKFSQPGVAAAAKVLREGGQALDAIEKGITTVELDETVTSVGYGGLPNAEGILQLDAAIMTHSGDAGAVMAVDGFPAAVPLARLVLERSPHTALAGKGARQFAVQNGLRPRQHPSELLSQHAKARYEQFRTDATGAQSHGDNSGGMAHTDTVGMIARDASEALVAGCATSGMQFKAVGRVGDSPIIGAGLYADRAGAAVASGDGDRLLRFCISFLVVERMRAGATAEDACRFAMRRVHDAEPSCQAAVTAMSSDGGVGAACTHLGFSVAHWNSGMQSGHAEIRAIDGINDIDWRHTCV